MKRWFLVSLQMHSRERKYEMWFCDQHLSCCIFYVDNRELQQGKIAGLW